MSLLETLEGYPSWFKSRKKSIQFFLVTTGVCIIPFLLYPFSELALRVRSDGLPPSTNSFAWSLIAGYMGAILCGFIAGNKGLSLYMLIAISLVPVVYLKADKGSVSLAILLSFLMLFSIFPADSIGARNAPLGMKTRERIDTLLSIDVLHEDGVSSSSEVLDFIQLNKNWASRSQEIDLRLNVSIASLRLEAHQEEQCYSETTIGDLELHPK